ncbi:MAG: hypothetical protein JXA04_11375 [Gammaproteobacteria bacterium]|nr:hypothetical protein [Gammaproteobacteria bacterium]
MRAWEKIGEDANIVLVGNFNPSIFHPEWFIKRGIVPDWNYSGHRSGTNEAAVAVLPDLAQIDFQDQKFLQVMLNKFTLRCSHASEFLSLKDIVSTAFSILKETPISQMGMNYQAVIRIADNDLWLKFGEVMAPKEPWLVAAPYINELDDGNKKRLGLWNLTMQMPRPDDLSGYIRPTVKVENSNARTLSISVNNHVEIADKSTATVIDYLERYWEQSLNLANEIVRNTLIDQLGEEG